MIRRLLPFVVVAMVSALLTAVFQPFGFLSALAQGQPACRTFPETGYTVCGKFLQYWTEKGGLPQQGYPISSEFQEKSDLDGKIYTVQYFERAVFELHPENNPPYDVLLSQLGTFRLRDKYPGGLPAPSTPVVPPPSTPGTTVTGAIAGTLRFPSEVIPPLAVYAISTTGGRYFTVNTAQNQQQFTIPDVTPGTYYVVAYPQNQPNSTLAGAYTAAVECGLTSACTDHTPVPVTVFPGRTVQDTRVWDWYAPPGTFPPRPGP
jgi:hypothetical protein